MTTGHTPGTTSPRASRSDTRTPPCPGSQDTAGQHHAAGGERQLNTGDVQDGQLVAVQDGPLAGQWFTLADWQERLRAARRMLDASGRRSPSLDYVPAGYQLTNPVLDHTYGQAAVYRPSAGSAQGSASAHDQGAPNVPGTGAAAADGEQDAGDAAGDVADAEPAYEAVGEHYDVFDVAG
jgi:hypothetical protein